MVVFCARSVVNLMTFSSVKRTGVLQSEMLFPSSVKIFVDDGAFRRYADVARRVADASLSQVAAKIRAAALSEISAEPVTPFAGLDPSASFVFCVACAVRPRRPRLVRRSFPLAEVASERPTPFAQITAKRAFLGRQLSVADDHAVRVGSLSKVATEGPLPQISAERRPSFAEVPAESAARPLPPVGQQAQRLPQGVVVVVVVALSEVRSKAALVFFVRRTFADVRRRPVDGAVAWTAMCGLRDIDGAEQSEKSEW